MASYKTFLASEQEQIQLLDEFQQKIKKRRNQKTLTQTWAPPLSRDLFASLMYRKMVHVSTTIDNKAIIGYIACLSRLQAREIAMPIVEAVCECIKDTYPLFTVTVLSPDCNQENVLSSLLKEAYDRAVMQSDYFSTMVMIAQSNAYLSEYFRTFGYTVQHAVIAESRKPATNVFTLKLSY